MTNEAIEAEKCREEFERAFPHLDLLSYDDKNYNSKRTNATWKGFQIAWAIRQNAGAVDVEALKLHPIGSDRAYEEIIGWNDCVIQLHKRGLLKSQPIDPDRAMMENKKPCYRCRGTGRFGGPESPDAYECSRCPAPDREVTKIVDRAKANQEGAKKDSDRLTRIKNFISQYCISRTQKHKDALI